jgi:hypothetical protein
VLIDRLCPHFAARDVEHSNAAVLVDLLRDAPRA